jgi:hypothetical protein
VDVLNYGHLRDLDLPHTASTTIPMLPYIKAFTALAINMSHNYFTIFTSQHADALDTNRAVVLDLTHNNIVCDCVNIDTILALQMHQLNYLNSVTCRLGNSISVQHVLRVNNFEVTRSYILVIELCVLRVLYYCCCSSSVCNNAGCHVP